MLLNWRRKSLFEMFLAAMWFFFISASFPVAGASENDALQQIAQFENGLRSTARSDGQAPERWTLRERMEFYGVPGVSIAVIKGGELVWAKGYGVKDADSGEPIDTETVFSVASISKLGTAVIVLSMAAEGSLELDEDVNQYLKSWKTPNDEFRSIKPITLRMLLSHTSGLSVHGFPDFLPGEALPTTLDVLHGRPPAKTKPVRPLFVPGTEYKYSGGGTTVEQLVIEETTGKTFNDAAKKYLFEPLKMNRSTYKNPLPASHGNIAKAHDEHGNVIAKPRGWHTMPEAAASGLWTTPSDLAKLLMALQRSYVGEDDAILPRNLAVEMMTEVGPSLYGLGPQLAGQGERRRFQHGGSNDAYKAWMEGHLESGDGYVILTNGMQGKSLFFEIRRAIADVLDWPLHEQIVEKNFGNGEESAKALTGAYAIDKSPAISTQRIRATMGTSILTIRFVSEDNRFYLSFDDKSRDPIPLLQTAPLTFVLKDEEAFEPTQLQFIRDAQGEVREFIVSYDGYSVAATRVTPANR